MERILKIKVIGNSLSGKSNVALLIKDTLAVHGIDVNINEMFPDEYVEDELRTIRPEAMKNLKEVYEGRTIQLDVLQANRTTLSESDDVFKSTVKQYNHEGIEEHPKGEIHEQGYQYCKHCDDTTPHRPKMDAVKNGQRVCNECDCCNYY